MRSPKLCAALPAPLRLHPATPTTRGLRQHAAPHQLRFFDAPTDGHGAVVHLPTTFAVPGLPLHVEVGCASGDWLTAVAAAAPHLNHLGLDIRAESVRRATDAAPHRGTGNVAFALTNLALSWQALFGGGDEGGAGRAGGRGGGAVAAVSLLHPDPRYKPRAAKHRFLAGGTPRLLAHLLARGTGSLLLQTDERFLMEWMHEQVEGAGEVEGGGELEGNGRAALPWFERQPDPTGPPMGVATPREIYSLARGDAVYRALYTRTDAPVAVPPAVVPRPPAKAAAVGAGAGGLVGAAVQGEG